MHGNKNSKAIRAARGFRGENFRVRLLLLEYGADVYWPRISRNTREQELQAIRAVRGFRGENFRVRLLLLEYGADVY